MNRFSISVRTRPLALAALAALSAAAWVASSLTANAAQPSVNLPEITVYYRASDLASVQAARSLYQRLVHAAREICPAYDSRDLDAFAASRACQQQAVARAIDQISSPRLAAVYARAPGRG